MDYERFVSIVERSSQLDREPAARAVEATLRTLAERLSSGEARKLADQLPPELLGLLRSTSGPLRMDVDEFLQHVAEREGVDVVTAERHARAVVAALKRAVSRDELAGLRAALPQDFEELLSDIPPVPMEMFLGRVAKRTGLDRSGAERATNAVLETLGERIAPGEVKDLIAQLAFPLHAPLKRGMANSNAATRRMPVDRFVERVAELEGTAIEPALQHAQAVLLTLREAIDDQEFFDITVQLPMSYDALLRPRPVVEERNSVAPSSN